MAIIFFIFRIKKKGSILVIVRQAFMDHTAKRRLAYVPKILAKMEALVCMILKESFVTVPQVSQGFYARRGIRWVVSLATV